MKLYIRLTGTIIIVSAIFLVVLPGAADVMTIGAAKDNTLYEQETGNLSNGAGSHLFAGKTQTGVIRRGLIMFDVAGNLPAGVNITNAVLTLNMSKTISGTQTVSLHTILVDWGEGTSDAADDEGKGTTASIGDATWLHTFHSNAFWSAGGGDFTPAPSAAIPVAGNGKYSWETPKLGIDVQDWLDNPENNFGWLIQGNESTSTTAKRFDTKENATEANRPSLEIAYVIPEPGFHLALLAGLFLSCRNRS